ncbi:hypothetical protein PMAYCL1PPCAC_15634 [Pristionchus mayeri]|uniref:Uncharacterized protein n=1 Tax=Pristionchus mayeri TaxID=1317129 RepID=A0AAN5CJC9_9BILA|nr:hypothetical protein PMAYCL1PPCAC_15634 [Pristionchus mayeri]
MFSASNSPNARSATLQLHRHSCDQERGSCGVQQANVCDHKFEKERFDHRFQSAGEHGQVPSKWQKRFLIWTKLYKNQSEIPESVDHNIINRMNDRLRVLFIAYGCIGCFLIAFSFKRINSVRVNRDREAGIVVKSI